MRCEWVLVLPAWPLGCDLSSLTPHIPISPEAGSILTSPLLRNINGVSATTPDSLQALNALWPWGEGHTGSLASEVRMVEGRLAAFTGEGLPMTPHCPALRLDGTVRSHLPIPKLACHLPSQDTRQTPQGLCAVCCLLAGGFHQI